MSKATYTSGPWDVHESNAIVGQKLDDHPIWLRPVIARFETGVKEADARLMAAAPELLEACVAMLEWDDREKDHAVDFNARMDLCRAAFDKARAAIAKATGEAA